MGVCPQVVIDSQSTNSTAYTQAMSAQVPPALAAGTWQLLVSLPGIGHSAPVNISVPYTVTSVTPTSGSLAGGTLVTIAGTGFSDRAADVAVAIGGVPCTIQSAAATQITCVTGRALSGVAVAAAQVAVRPSAFTPLATVSGIFYPLCWYLIHCHRLAWQLPCHVHIVTMHDLHRQRTRPVNRLKICKVLAHAAAGVTYAYQSAPVVTGVTPPRGSTAGGTQVILTGSGFTNNVVSIAFGVTACESVAFVSATELRCANADLLAAVNPLVGSKRDLLSELQMLSYCQMHWIMSLQSVLCTLPKGFANQKTFGGYRCTTAAPATKQLTPSPVYVSFPSGYADTTATYHFVDLWSRSSTWGGGPLPVEGDSIVIPAGTTVLLDVPRGRLPRLHTLILQGDLEFDQQAVNGVEPDMHLDVRLAAPLLRF